MAQSKHHDPALDHVEAWVFDLDNTLYPASCKVFDQVDVLITRFIREFLNVDAGEADRLRKHYWHNHGTTMNGLMHDHGIDPDAYMDFVHGIDYGIIPADPALGDVLARLEGPKYIFTNANVGHAETVLDRIGIAGQFDAIFDIKASSYIPKPQDHFYDTFLANHGVDPHGAILVEDLAKNLKPGHARGMTTVLVETDSEFAMRGHDEGHVHHVTDDLTGWLTGVIEARNGSAAR
jgi:putative hydrolase of the HAD superfamily